MITTEVNIKKKINEKNQLEMFLKGIVNYSSIKENERPDWWVYCTNGPEFAVEITEYHPFDLMSPHRKRKEIEVCWYKNLWPTLDKVRRIRDSLKYIHANLYFKNKILPPKKNHKRIAKMLIELIAELTPKLSSIGKEIEINFLPRDLLNAFPQNEKIIRLAREDWSLLDDYFPRICINRYEVLWPPWDCPQASMSFVSPSSDEFNRILKNKSLKAKGYKLHNKPLWLLIVCGVQYDTTSQIFLFNLEYKEKLFKVIEDTKFNFDKSPFNEIWLLQQSDSEKLRLYPRN